MIRFRLWDDPDYVGGKSMTLDGWICFACVALVIGAKVFGLN